MSDYICPYTCSYRTNSGFCGHTGGWERCQYRQLHQPNTVVGYVPPLKKTNADRIRGYTDEELAIHFSATTCPSKEARKKCVTYGQYEDDGCVQCWLDWLKQEAEDGEDD